MKVREDFSEAVSFEQGPPKEVKEEAKLVSRKKNSMQREQPEQKPVYCQLLSWVGAKSS